MFVPSLAVTIDTGSLYPHPQPPLRYLDSLSNAQARNSHTQYSQHSITYHTMARTEYITRSTTAQKLQNPRQPAEPVVLDDEGKQSKLAKAPEVDDESESLLPEPVFTASSKPADEAASTTTNHSTSEKPATIKSECHPYASQFAWVISGDAFWMSVFRAGIIQHLPVLTNCRDYSPASASSRAQCVANPSCRHHRYVLAFLAPVFFFSTSL